MHRLMLAVSLIFGLSGCALLTPAPASRPPLQPYAQELSLSMTYDLCKTGEVHAVVRGSPDDAQRAIAEKANRTGIRWYRIIMISETVIPGRWYGEAIFYGTYAGSCTRSAPQP